MQVCSARAGGDGPLKSHCASILSSAKRYSLQHALLAGLPFRGCVTTNYDELFERAVKLAGHDMTTWVACARDARRLAPTPAPLWNAACNLWNAA